MLISMRPTSSQSPSRPLPWVWAAANRPLLAAEPSAALRDQLIAEITGLMDQRRACPVGPPAAAGQKHAHEGRRNRR
jgi:hypothetical protein